MSLITRRWIAALTLALTAFCVDNTYAQNPPANGLLREVWSNIQGGLVSDLTNNAAYPDNPTSSNYVTDFFEAPIDVAEFYGQRMRGYIVPPTTGNYVFWVATDDQGVLYLSTDADPANKQQIAYVPGWTSSRNWFGYGEQQSAAISLQAGRAYYVEALMKENGGGDNLAVRWQLPNGTIEEPIPASRLRPWGIVFTAPDITQQPSNTTAVEGGDATFSVRLSNLDPVFYQWQRNGATISGANAPDYLRTNVALADHNSTYRCFVSNSLGDSFSASATLTVTADTTKPTLVAAQNASANTIQLVFSEPVEAASATTASNYQIDGGLTISAAVMGADTRTVILTASAAFAYETVYTLRVSGVRDRAVAQNVILANSAITFTAREYVPINIGGMGATTSVNGGVNVSAVGADIGGTSDQFHFAYQQRTGNFDIQARLQDFAGADMWSKAGLMARETLTENSRFAGSFATPSLAGAFALSRATVGGATTQAGYAPVNYPNTWLRLARSANVFTAYASIDGERWLSLGSVTIAMPSTIYLGMAVSSHSAQSAIAQFRDIGAATGTIVTTLPVKGEPLAASSRRTGMIVSEIMYHPAARADGKDLEFVELFNTDPVSEDMTGFRISGDIDFVFPAGTILPGGGFLVVAKDPAAVRSVYGINNVVGPYAGTLSNDSGDVRVHNESDAEILDARFSDAIEWPQGADGAGHSLALAQPSYGEGQRQAWAASAVMGGSPGRPEPIRSDIYEPLVINEILAHTDDPQKDYIEIYNHSNSSINLSGVSLADNRELTNRYTFQNGTTIPARGFLAVDQDALGFALNAGGETIYLVASNDVRVIDAVRFEGQENGVPHGRYPDGAARFARLQSVTQGGANARPVIPNVVINEIMYHPISDNDDDEYVELLNRSGAAIDLSGWKFTDGIDFIFPPGTTIAANGYLVVAKNVGHIRTNYANLDAANSIGDYDGTLSNSGERLALSMPEEVVSTNEFGLATTNVIDIVVAEVEYNEGGRWGQWADGGGSSLELVDPRADLMQASNWANSNEESKAPWTTIQATGVLDNGGMSNPNQFQMHLQGGGECMVDDVEVFRSGGANLITNPGFESDMTGWVAQGSFNQSSIAAGGGFNGTKGLRVTSPVRGDTGANRIRYNINATALTAGNTVTLRAKVRWLKGWPEFLLRLRGNWLEAYGQMTLPTNLGTPGQANSRARANIGPAIYEVAHTPILPAAGQAVVVTARVSDPDGNGTPQVRYRIDPNATFLTVNMNDGGTGGDAVANDGIWSATVPQQSSGALAVFYVQAADLAAPAVTATFPSDAPTRSCLVRWGETQDTGTFATYRLWMSQATINTWSQREVLNNAPLDVTFVYRNNRVVYNVGSLYSGSPFHAGYNGPTAGICDYVVNFPDDDLFLGSTDFVLNSVGNLDNDNSAQREQAAFWMARKLGALYNHRRHVHLFVNGQRRGKVFEDAQQPNSAFLEGWFPEDPNGQLLKIEDWFEFSDSVSMLGNVDATLGYFTTTGGALKTARYRWCWRPRAVQKSANDFTDFFELVRAANDGTGAYTTRLDNIADMEEWMRIFCVEHMVGNWDAYGYSRGKNMFAYRPRNGKWALMAWDIDFVLDSGGNGPTTDMFAGINDGAVGTMMNNPQFRRAYYRAMLDAVNGPLAPENIHPVLDARRYALLQNGVNVPDTASIKSYISARRTHLQSTLAGVAANFAITSNNGNNFSTNRSYITITGTAPIAVKTIEVNGAPYPVTWTGVTTWSMAIPLTAASNVLNLRGFDAHGNEVAGATDTITITYTGALTSPKDIVVINEIMYNPAAPDASFIELYNNSTTAGFDLSGYRLEGVGFTFPSGSVIAPNSYMVIAKSTAAFTAAYGSGIPIAGNFPGSLDNGGERLTLIKPGATPEEDEIIDVLRYDDDPPWPIAADGTGPSLQLIDPTKDNSRVGNWAANTGAVKYTPGAANNVRATIAAYPTLWINEVLPNNTDGITDNNSEREPWVEIYNSGATTVDLSPYYLTDSYTTLQKWQFPAGTSLNPGQFLLVWLDNEPGETISGALHANFRLNATNGSIALVRVQGAPAVIDYINYNITSANRSFGSYPDGQSFDRQLFHYITPRLANDNRTLIVPVTINEWMSSNTRTLLDPADRRPDDWFELYNSGTTPVDLSGYYLTDNVTNWNQFRIPPGYVVPAQGYLIVWADENHATQNTATNADLHVNFKLSNNGEQIGLFGADGTQIDAVTFVNQVDDASHGRFPDGGAAPYYYMQPSTPRAANRIASGNQPPTLSGVSSGIIQEDALHTFQATATDPDAGQTLAFSLVEAPPGAAIDPTSGVFTWTPTETQGPGDHTFVVRVTDSGSPALSRSVQITLSVMESNRAPALGSLPDIDILEEAAYSAIVPATDPDLPAQPLQFFLDEGPAGLTLDANTGRLQWTPTEAQGPGVYPVTVRVVDGASPTLSDSDQFTITVRDVNAPPTLAQITDQIVIEGDTLTITPVASDSDIPAQTLSFSAQAPTGAQINPTTGVFTWTPSAAQIPGTNSVTITVTDNGSPAQSASRQFLVVTAKENHPPTFTAVSDQTAPEEADYSLQLEASDIDPGQALTFAIEGAAPSGLTISSAGLIQWRPTEDQGPSTNQVTVRVSDNGSPARSVTGTVKIIVTEVNLAPAITTIANQVARVGEPYTLDVVATDADRPVNSITFSLDAPVPAGMAINATSGRITWTPDAVVANTDVPVTVRAADSGTPALSGTRAFNIRVNPAINWKFVSVTGTASSSTIYVYLEAPGRVLLDDIQLVAGATPATGPNLLPNGNFETALSGPWIVTAGFSGSYVTNVAKNGAAALNLVSAVNGTTRATSVYQDIVPTLTVGAQYTLSYWFVPNTNNVNLTIRLSGNGIVARTNIFEQPNRAPTLGNLPDRQIPEAAPYTFTATATDPDVPAQQLQFFMDEGPAGATLNTSGRFDWTPTEAQGPGVYPVTIRVVDNGSPSASASRRFFITVNEVNTAPTLAAISDQLVIEGNTLVIDPVASDSDLPAQTLTFITSGIANAQINPSTGRFTWTPTAAQVPSTNTVTIQVADSADPALTASRTFTVVTDVGNHPPTFNSLPTQSVQEDTDFSLQLVAQDPDAGQALSFSLEAGAPAGVTLTSGGLLQWHPTKAQGPSTNQINFRITDNGFPVRSITAFVTIIVTEPTPPPTIDLDATLTTTGEIQLRWDSAVGVVYRVYVRDDIETGIWQSTTEITATGATTTYRAPANGSATRFIKVMALP